MSALNILAWKMISPNNFCSVWKWNTLLAGSVLLQWKDIRKALLPTLLFRVLLGSKVYSANSRLPAAHCPAAIKSAAVIQQFPEVWSSPLCFPGEESQRLPVNVLLSWACPSTRNHMGINSILPSISPASTYWKDQYQFRTHHDQVLSIKETYLP